MCATCGCSDVHPAPEEAEVPPGHEPHVHPHPHPHPHAHPHPAVPDGPHRRVLRLELDVLAENDRIAAENRAWLEARGILALNLVSSPGAGKTTLLERTISDLRGELTVAVIEGDQETPLDAERIRAAGCPAVQVNTGRGCHLDASQVGIALRALDPPPGALLLVETVGNLVCPALFDLGEHAKVVVASTPEGEDKPLKYPHVFRASALVLLNKIDLVPHLAFDAGRFLAHARQVNPRIEALSLSATRREGLDGWYGWLRARRTAIRAA
jgi:hydrogenase nickel incorporation protein HypB